MKYVSRMVFGLSIAAVLALFTACPQAADTKKNSPNLNPLGIKQTDVADTISKMDSIKDNFDIEKGNITIKKAAASSITLPEKFGDNRTLKDVKITSGKSVTVEKSGKDFTLKVTKPTNGKAETVTLELKIEGKDKSGKTATSTISVTITNKKNIEEGSQPPASIKTVTATAKAGTAGAATLKMTLENDGDSYDKVKISVAKLKNGAAGDTDPAKFKGNQDAIEIAKKDFAGLTNGAGYDVTVESPAQGATYQFTFQLLKGSQNVGNPAMASSTLGEAAQSTPASIKTVTATAKAGTAGAATLKMTLENDGDSYDKVKISVAKLKNGAAGDTDPAKFKGNQDAIEIAKKDFAGLTNGAGYDVTVESPAQGATYQFTFQLLKGSQNVGNPAMASSTLGE
ncbi:MAG: hypothetical protein ACTTH7_01705 [Treponema sp.]